MYLRQISLVLVLLQAGFLIQSVVSQDHFNRDGGKKFCLYAPNNNQIASYQKSCKNCKLFTKPLRAISKCCTEHPIGNDRVRCLDEIRVKELEVEKLFLKWKEPASRDAQYLRHMEKCASNFENAFEKLNCQQDHKDPVEAYFEKCAKSKTSPECTEGFVRKVKWDALDSLCVHNTVDDHILHSDKSKKFSSVHYRCWQQQALTKKLKSIIEIAADMNKDCLNQDYGIETDWDTYLFKTTIEASAPTYWNLLKERYYGILDKVENNADGYLDSICVMEKNYYNPALDCIETPITESFLTYKSTKSFVDEVESCCKGVKLPISSSDKAKVKKCLDEKYMYEQFFPLSGLYARGLMRENLGVMWECENEQMFDRGLDSGYDMLTNAEKAKFYSHHGYPDDIEDSMRLVRTMTPESYHFFLRGYTSGNGTLQGGNYEEAACEACVLGERLASQAYIYPGLMCPALVAEVLYKPIQFESICPDKLFYKFQVANYCCLDRALEQYNLGPNFDPETCPDMKHVKVECLPKTE